MARLLTQRNFCAFFPFSRFTPAFMFTASSKVKFSSHKYHFIDDVETLEDYKPGGFHPIMIGDVLKNRYRIVHKLGYGSFSTIWLSRDEKRAAYVAVKVCVGKSSTREADVIRALTTRSTRAEDPARAMIPLIQGEFEVQGPNGSHKCYVTSPAQFSLSDATYSHCFKSEVARSIAAQLILATYYTHTQGVVHGDIHLGNILVRLSSSLDHLSIEQFYDKFDKPSTEEIERLDGEPNSPNVPSHATTSMWLGKRADEIPLAEAHILLSDFGEAFYPSDPEQMPLGKQCHSPLAESPPETKFEPNKPFSFPADIWTLACAIWETFGSNPLFMTIFGSRHDIHLQQIDVLGPLPSEWWDKWEARHKYFDDKKQPKDGRHVYPPLEDCIEKEIQASRRQHDVDEFDKEEMAALLKMLRPMLSFRPEERPTITTVLESDWMVNWGLPQLEKVPKV